MIKILISSTLALATFSLPSFAASIILYNTGVDNGGNLLPNSTLDPHYSLVSAPSPFTAAYTGNGSDVVAMPWLQEGPNSRWIGVSTFMGEWRPTGLYTFRTTFDLTGLLPSTAGINLMIASDNTCDVFLNGVHAGITTPFAGFSSFSSYTISSGFINGLNTLDFQVYEPGSTPSGLRVELSGQAAVPEPTAMALGGLAGLMLILSRRKS